MQTNYLHQAKSFLSQNTQRLALRVVPIALVAVAAAHATPTFSPNGTSVTGCGSGGSASGTLASALTNGGRGISLSGLATFTSGGIQGGCNLVMAWLGTGSGTFNGNTATLAANFTITPPANVFVGGWTLLITINGQVQPAITCTNIAAAPLGPVRPRSAAGFPPCTGPITIPTQNIPVPASLASYLVTLSVNAQWQDSTNSTVTVNVPAGSSIDITAQGAASSVPALTPAGVGVTGLMLMAIALYSMSARKNSNGGFPTA